MSRHSFLVLFLMCCVHQLSAVVIQPFKDNKFLADITFTYEEQKQTAKGIRKGVMRGFGLTHGATLETIQTDKGEVILLMSEPINPLSVAVLNPVLFSSFNIEQVRLVASSSQYRYQDELYYQVGLNTIGELPLKEVLAPLAYLSGVAVGTLAPFIVNVPAEEPSVELNITLPGYRRINEMIAYDKIMATVKLPADISVWLDLHIKPSSQAPEFVFTAMGQFKGTPPSFGVAASSEQQWKNTFGIQGLTIEALGCAVGLLPVATPPFVLPNKFALTGKLTVGSTVVQAAASVAVPPSIDELGLYGYAKELRMSDLITFAGKLVGKDIPKNKVPELTVQENELLIAPSQFYIGGIHFDRGFIIKNSLLLFGKKVSNKFILTDRGLVSQQYMDPFSLGVVKVEGDGPTGGPELFIGITLSPEFKITGDVAIGSYVRGKTAVQGSSDQFSFTVKDSLKIDEKRSLSFTARGSFSLQQKQVKIDMQFDPFVVTDMVSSKLAKGSLRLPFEITQISFSGSAEEVAEGVLPRLQVVFKIGQNVKSFQMSFSMIKPKDALKTLVASILELLAHDVDADKSIDFSPLKD